MRIIRKCASISQEQISTAKNLTPSGPSADRFEFEAAQLAQCKYEEIYDCYLLINIIYGFLSSPGAPACVLENVRATELLIYVKEERRFARRFSDQLREIFNSIPLARPRVIYFTERVSGTNSSHWTANDGDGSEKCLVTSGGGSTLLGRSPR